MDKIKRDQLIGIIIILAVAFWVYVYVPHYMRDDSDGITATCTVTKAYTKECGDTVSGMNDIRPKGFFETKECGTLTMFAAPEGRKIPEYVETAQPGKKYLFHVANSSPRKDRDFVTTRFEEIKE